jgi:hypothetical protein
MESGRGVMLTIHLHLAPSLRMSEAILLLPLLSFMVWIETNLPFTFFHFSLGFCELSLPFFFIPLFLPTQLFLNSAMTKPKI